MRALLGELLASLNLSSSRRNYEFLVNQLKALSGRMALRLTREQIARLCQVQHTSGRSTRKHLSKLLQAEYLQRHHVPVALPGSNGAAPVYYPTKAGAELLASWFDDERDLATITRHPRFDLSIRAHDDIQLDKATGATHGVRFDAGDTFVNLTDITVSGAGAGSYIDVTSTPDLEIVSNLTANGAITLTSRGVLDGNYTLDAGSELVIEFAGTGTTAGTDFDQVHVTGSNRAVAINGATLNVTSPVMPPFGTLYVIINNQSPSSTVSGTFAGLPEGATIDGGSAGYEISYRGGDGNDVVLKTVTPDFGDAPTAAQSGFLVSYPVTLADNGARHIVVGPKLGSNRDRELDGQPSSTATGDDLTGTPDDEDGIVSLSSLIRDSNSATIASITINLQSPDPVSNRLDAWINFNRDGDCSDAGEHILVSADLGTTAGLKSLSFSIPAGSEVGTTFARFRLSTFGGLETTGLTLNGEVEDHAVTLLAAGQPTTVDPVSANGSITVSVVGSNIVISQNGQTLQLFPHSGAGNITINGNDNVDGVSALVGLSA